MKKNYLKTLPMTLVLVALVAWYFGYEKKLRVSQEAKEEGKKQLIAIGKDEIQEITIEKNAPGYPVKLKRSGDRWSLTAPIEDATDSTAVNGFINSLTTTKYEEVVDENPADLDKYGLKTPALTVSAFKDSKTPPEKVLFGLDTPVGGAVYIKTSRSNAVYRVPSFAKGASDKTAKDLRERFILSLTRNDISEIEIQNTKGTILLLKGEKDLWSLPRENLSVDFEESNKLINSLLEAKASDYVDEKNPKPEAYGLNHPKIKIWIANTKSKNKTSLALSRVGDKVYLRRDEKAIFQVSQDLWDKWDVDPTGLRSKDVAAFNRFDVKRVKLERSSEPLELYRQTSDWEFPSEPSAKIDPLKVDAWLTTLQDMKLQRYAQAKGKVSVPRLTVRLYEKKDNGEAERVTLKFGNSQSGHVVVERSGLDYLFFIKDDDYRKLDQKKFDFLKKAEKPVEPGGEKEKKS